MNEEEEAQQSEQIVGEVDFSAASMSVTAAAKQAATLAGLPIGAKLMLRCRADWRVATVSAINSERVILSVGSPSGRTYRVKRPSASSLIFDGSIPLLGEGQWRAGIVRYDVRG